MPIVLRCREADAYSSGSLAMSFPDDEDQDFAILILRYEFVAGLAAPVREIDRGGGIGRQDPQQFARLHGRQPLSRLEHRQRAQQAPYIDFRLVVYQVPVLLDWRRLYFVNADLSA
jgi:hypothetical protein